MEPFTPQQGQYFSVAPPLPKPRSWLIPISAGAISLIGALFVSAGQPPAPKSSAPPSPASSQAPPAQPPPSPAVIVTPTPQTNAHVINCDRIIGANFRRYPSLDKSAIVLVIPCGQPLTVTGEQARSPGVTWLAVRYQQMSGWVASELIRRN